VIKEYIKGEENLPEIFKAKKDRGGTYTRRGENRGRVLTERSGEF